MGAYGTWGRCRTYYTDLLRIRSSSNIVKSTIEVKSKEKTIYIRNHSFNGLAHKLQ